MLKQGFLAHFEAVVTHFGPWKIPKCLENAPFWDQTRFKNGSKARFSKSARVPSGMLKQVNEVISGPFSAILAHSKPKKATKIGHRTKCDPVPFGMHMGVG